MDLWGIFLLGLVALAGNILTGVAVYFLVKRNIKETTTKQIFDQIVAQIGKFGYVDQGAIDAAITAYNIQLDKVFETFADKEAFLDLQSIVNRHVASHITPVDSDNLFVDAAHVEPHEESSSEGNILSSAWSKLQKFASYVLSNN